MSNTTEKKEQEQIIEDKSTYKLIEDIDFSKEITINRIFADTNLIAQHRDKLIKGIKNISPQALDHEIVQIVIKDNIFSAAMNEIVKHFEFDIDQDYLKFVKENLSKTIPNGDKISPDTLNIIADKIIKKGIVFKYLTKLWNVSISDDEIKAMLDIYYEKTNDSIHEVLKDKNKFESIRLAILEEKLILKTIGAFPVRFNLINPSFDSKQNDVIDSNMKKN